MEAEITLEKGELPTTKQRIDFLLEEDGNSIRPMES